MKSLIQSLKLVAHQAEVTKLVELLNAPVIYGYVSTTKKTQNPREVFPLPFHVAIAFEDYVRDNRRPQQLGLPFPASLWEAVWGNSERVHERLRLGSGYNNF